jgi:hypothetical protein
MSEPAASHLFIGLLALKQQTSNQEYGADLMNNQKNKNTYVVNSFINRSLSLSLLLLLLQLLLQL